MKNGLKTIQAAAYNGTRMVLDFFKKQHFSFHELTLDTFIISSSLLESSQFLPLSLFGKLSHCTANVLFAALLILLSLYHLIFSLETQHQFISIFFDRAPAAQNGLCLKGGSSLQFTLCDKKILVNPL